MPSTTNMGCGPLTVKYLMFFFNLIFFIAGLGLIIIGGIAQGFFKEYISFFADEYKSPAIGFIILGTVVLFISFFGCCGARINNVCMLRIFAFFLGALIIFEIAGGVSIAFKKGDIENVVRKNMNETLYEYGQNDTLVTQTWDDMQSTYHCCGAANYTDWAPTIWGNNSDVPDSCCKIETKGCGKDAINNPEDHKIYTDGCFEALKESALHNLGAIVGAAVAIGLIQIIGIWMSCCLIDAIKQNYELI